MRRLPLELVFQGEPVLAWSGRRLLGDGGDRLSDVFACDHAWPLLGILAPLTRPTFSSTAVNLTTSLVGNPPVLVRELSYYLHKPCMSKKKVNRGRILALTP